MRGVLSSNIDHYKYTARALQEEDILERYICCAFYKEKPWYYNKIKMLNGWIDNRIDNELDYNLVSSFKYQEIIYKIIRNSFITRYIHKDNIDKLFNRLYDSRNKRILNNLKSLDYFHYLSGVGYESALKAKSKFNSKIIVDDRAEHQGYLHKILIEEYEKLGIEYKNKDLKNVGCRKDYDIADYIITPSTFSRDTFISEGIDPKKLVVIPYGCNTDLFYPMPKKNDSKFRVIYVGNVCIRKGAYYLLEAFKKINNPNIELLIIGKIEPELESYMKSSKNNVKHINYVPNNKLNEYYSQSDVFVLPSLSDSFSLATLEAMSAGLPVIISENVGAKDFVENNVNGYIIPIRDSNIIKEKVEYMYSNRKYFSEIRNNSYELKEKINWENYKNKIKKFYNDILVKY